MATSIICKCTPGAELSDLLPNIDFGLSIQGETETGFMIFDADIKTLTIASLQRRLRPNVIETDIDVSTALYAKHLLSKWRVQKAGPLSSADCKKFFAESPVPSFDQLVE
jgi:hypothetical protein